MDAAFNLLMLVGLVIALITLALMTVLLYQIVTHMPFA
jgi:hypothetical protein